MKTEIKIIIVIAIVMAVVCSYILFNHKGQYKPAKPLIKPDTTKDSVWYDRDGNGHFRP